MEAGMRCGWAVALGLFVCASAAEAVTLTKVSENRPWPGVTVRKYRTASPAADMWVALVDLCTDSIHVDATKTPSGPQTTGTWAQGVGAQLATNGDFYATSPWHVYGQAVGAGVPWPLVNTGFDPSYSTEWFYKDAGWIAFGFDSVTYNHTKQVKKYPPAGATLGGWEPGKVVGTVPPGTLSLVSGFPELVTEGTRVTCSSATASSCFPDRSDMRARHPRTAMGLTQDMGTFILVVVDGRTSTSAGMYGTELAETIHKLGAWQAFNLDGGGSSQFWQSGRGYLNNYDGNNHGSGARAVLNHWGIFAGSGNGKPVRPGHCTTRAACQLIPAAGGTIDNDSACFRRFGPGAGWNKVSAGSGGTLYWTDAAVADVPSQWAWWRLEMQQAGTYRVEYYREPSYASFARTRYEILAGGTVQEVTVDQSRGTAGWNEIGTFTFAAGGDQYVRLYDNVKSGSLGTGKRVVVDAIRLVPATGSTCGNGTCGTGETCSSCPADCGACVRCGDGTCAASESCSTCEADCGACVQCGDGTCDVGETCSSCASDCGACARCGDGTCDANETCSNCAADCGTCVRCGDGTCASTETCATCASDCGACARCGDGTCDANETCSSCPGDCGSCVRCGDGTCASSETCSSCAQDCGTCVRCGDGTCSGSETCSTCASDCGTCVRCGDGTCSGSETCASCRTDCGACDACGNGTCDPGETCRTCAGDCGVCCGDGICDTDETCSSCESDCNACGACGDGTCSGGETCSNCAGDCGACATCGNGTCDSGESCDACSIDCGPCSACGNGRCGGGETCESCSLDCGNCNACGDGQCSGGETCESCPRDCTDCVTCGDGRCEGSETCEECETDCGACSVCGDGTCSTRESCLRCPQDCGACPGEAPDAGPEVAAEPGACGCAASDLSVWALFGIAVLRRRRGQAAGARAAEASSITSA